MRARIVGLGCALAGACGGVWGYGLAYGFLGHLPIRGYCILAFVHWVILPPCAGVVARPALSGLGGVWVAGKRVAKRV